MKKIIAILAVSAFVFLYNFDYAYAAVPAAPETPKEPIAVGPAERPDTYPYKKLYLITAYYMALPGQQHYAMGSYDAEVRMNGDMHSADGTVVYPGMVAAPKSYSFGTKMYIPGIGIVAVHDRGGAIVEAGQKNQQYDRLDIWMGKGDKGLERTLTWGKRLKEVIVYGIDNAIHENVYLEDYTLDEQKLVFAGKVPGKVPLKKYKTFPQDVWYLSKGEDVKKLQNVLYQLGYLDEQPNSFYGKTTRQAVFEFQKENDVVSGFDENGAGHTGPQTRWKLELTYTAFNKEKFPGAGLKKGSKDKENAKRLQKILAALGYKVEETGVFDEQTETAVLMFQIDHGILPAVDAFGAGVFGPKTRETLIKKYLAKAISGDKEEDETEPADYYASGFLQKDLKIGDKGKNVEALQKELARLNYLKIKPTGYYGVLTQHAVFKFQQAMALVDDEKKPYAGVLGPTTRGKLNQIIAERSYTRRMIAEKSKPQSQPSLMIAAAKMIPEEIDYGDSGEHVKKLQNALKKLGYFKSSLISGYFGDETKNAILKFQKEKGIISSENDTGAGRVGPATKDALNQVLSS